jgi:hypothetical protein
VNMVKHSESIMDAPGCMNNRRLLKTRTWPQSELRNPSIPEFPKDDRGVATFWIGEMWAYFKDNIHFLFYSGETRPGLCPTPRYCLPTVSTENLSTLRF